MGGFQACKLQFHSDSTSPSRFIIVGVIVNSAGVHVDQTVLGHFSEVGILMGVLNFDFLGCYCTL